MTDARLTGALGHWGLESASATLVAKRENTVYRVDAGTGRYALRFHRAGLRSLPELTSELDWMRMLRAGGITCPDPLSAADGSFHLDCGDTTATTLHWLDGTPMGRDGVLLPAPDPERTFAALGETMARMHDLADSWQPPAGFCRHSWDCDDLVGDTPVWGRFWENPDLSGDEAALLIAMRDCARNRLAVLRANADYGLVHADLVPENLLLHPDGLRVIDFDDGGFGFRLFDLATAANRADRADPEGGLKAALMSGYGRIRRVDLPQLDLFQALRALTYVGWIIPRMAEQAGTGRCRRFIAEACRRADRYMQTAAEDR